MTTPVRQQTVTAKDESGAVASLTLEDVDGTLGGTSAGIIVDVAWGNDPSQTALSDVTFNGVSILANEIGAELADSNRSQRSFYVVGSSLPSADVVITMGASTLVVHGTARVYSNVNQAAPIGDIEFSQAGGVNGTATATADLALTANDVAVDQLVVRNTPTITIGADQSLTSTQTTGSFMQMRTSEQAFLDGTDAMSWSWDVAQRWNHKAYVVQGTGAAPEPPPTVVPVAAPQRNRRSSGRYM